MIKLLVINVYAVSDGKFQLGSPVLGLLLQGACEGVAPLLYLVLLRFLVRLFINRRTECAPGLEENQAGKK